jgi:hypothetical protein
MLIALPLEEGGLFRDPGRYTVCIRMLAHDSRTERPMRQTHLTSAIVLFVILELANTVINIVPALRQTTAQAKKPYFVRAGIVNIFLFVVLVLYLTSQR